VKKYSFKKQRVQKLINEFSKCKILVFGDVGVDKYTIGKVSRISPEAPIPIVEVTDTQLKLGLAANVADNIGTLGGKAFLVGILGKDSAANDFLNLLKTRKISNRYLVHDSSRKTIVKERVVAEIQQVVRIDHETSQKIDVPYLKIIWSQIEKTLKTANAIIIEDYAKGLVDMKLTQQVLEHAKRLNIPVFVDPNRHSSASLYYGSTVVTPNLQEAEVLSKTSITNAASLQRAGYRLLEEMNATHVVITRGREGMAVFSKLKSEPWYIPAFAREVFDVSGAGDTAIATLALAYISGADIIEAALLANYAAGVVVGKRGTATVTQDELKEYIDFVGRYRNA